MQVLYLSNRPEVLGPTVEALRASVSAVLDVLVVTPGPTGLDGVTDLIEADLLSAAERRSVAEDDHGGRNTKLRDLAVRRGPVAERFLLSDDDYRPLGTVPDDFWQRDGRLRSYVSHDLARWRRLNTSYDGTQLNTWLALAQWGCPHLGYGAHLPQVMVRDHWVEAFDAWATLSAALDAQGTPLGWRIDEWSLPLNWGRRHHPQEYLPAETHRTLCWPEFPWEWPRDYRAPGYTFENYYPAHYRPGGLFEGLPRVRPDDPGAAAAAAFEKARRWHDLERRMVDLQPPAGVTTPWTGGPLARARLAALRQAKRARTWSGLGAAGRSDDLAEDLRRAATVARRPDPEEPAT
ncbi:MAG: hypothetical protein R2754_09735 [Microthrixaceae bacterium]